MLYDIHIKNFRCFSDTKVQGFQRLNLIGGKNNSGKTALLEAVYCCILPIPQSFLFLKHLRNESYLDSPSDKYWDNLFFNRNNNQLIQITSGYLKFIDHHDSLPITNSVIVKNLSTSEFDFNNTNIKFLNDNFKGKLTGNSRLTIKSESGNDNWHTEKEYTIIKRHSSDLEIISNQLTSQGILYKGGTKYQQKYSQYIEQFLKQIPVFSPSSLPKISSRELAQYFDLAILNEKSEEILKILQKLDPSIIEIRSLNIGEADIYLRREGETFLPISLFGDCFNRVLDIILRLINTKNSVCLIDEIENGIHYQNQREFWRSLFKLAVELDIQIFATTHSLEMIKAFADIGLEYPNEGAYFELARHEKTNQIVSIKRDLDVLQYSLKHEGGVGLRGE
ncbi:AAA family ATPase [Geminocystis herdmanii]|uniref:AAA family ATPase n=1 Tax=Geminocystis herdmanii TaxID=669359 RepID=UPI00034D3B0E|nr:AAA family ATPase [Geminocystis herdmanii]